MQAADSFGAVPLNEILRGDADITRLLDAIGAQDPENLTIRSRLRILQGTADGTVLPTFTNQLVDELRGRGAKLAYTTYDGVSYAGVIEAGGADAMRWIAKRLG